MQGTSSGLGDKRDITPRDGVVMVEDEQTKNKSNSNQFQLIPVKRYQTEITGIWFQHGQPNWLKHKLPALSVNLDPICSSAMNEKYTKF